MSQTTKNYILEDKIKTWLGRDINGVTIYPVIRNQNVLSSTSCVHHAFCPTIETMHQIKNPNNNHSIDIRWLIRTFPPPTTAKKLIEALRNYSGGDIKASNTDTSPFKVTGCSCYDISLGSSHRHKHIKKIVPHLRDNSPVMGSFYPDSDYNPSRDGIYVSKHSPVVKTCPECDRKVTLRHSVCLVGTALAMIDGKKTACFQYLESDNPEQYSVGKDGVCYMTVDSMHSIIIPTIE